VFLDFLLVLLLIFSCVRSSVCITNWGHWNFLWNHPPVHDAGPL